MKFLPMILATVLAATQKAFKFDFLNAPDSQRTPSIPNRGGRQHRPHAPNDGHWHMKFHRNR